jgi:hypothetical protein
MNRMLIIEKEVDRIAFATKETGRIIDITISNKKG